jgi:hypothetical protein
VALAFSPDYVGSTTVPFAGLPRVDITYSYGGADGTEVDARWLQPCRK